MWLAVAWAIPPGFVEVGAIEGVVVDARYASVVNFTGEPLPGYVRNRLWLEERTADALTRVQARAHAEGFRLWVYDAYRPVSATLAMVRWTQRVGRADLIENGYIAARSGHNKGHTVDLTLARDTGPIEMGTPWDTFSVESHTRGVAGEALDNRLRLKEWMEAEGFRAYSKEWWHFRLPVAGLQSLDEPYTRR